MRFAFIAKHREVWQTRRMCEALGVSRGGFYEWMSRPEAPRTQANRQLVVHIRTSFAQSDKTYGARRVVRDLRAWGHGCGRHRVERLMKLEGLKARPKRRRLRQCIPPAHRATHYHCRRPPPP